MKTIKQRGKERQMHHRQQKKKNREKEAYIHKNENKMDKYFQSEQTDERTG